MIEGFTMFEVGGTWTTAAEGGSGIGTLALSISLGGLFL